MTTAVCVHCGEFKFGSFVPCGSCNERPTTDHELIISMAMSDHYLDVDTLKQISASIREKGVPPDLDPDSYHSLRQLIEEARASGALDELFSIDENEKNRDGE